MQNISVQKLLKHAIGHAISDRESFIEAYNYPDPEVDRAKKLITQFESIRDKRVNKFTREEFDVARKAFIYGQQWCESKVDAQISSGMEVMKKRIEMYRAIRQKIWGLTILEVATSKEVPSRDLFSLSEHISNPHSSN